MQLIDDNLWLAASRFDGNVIEWLGVCVGCGVAVYWLV